MMGNHNKDRHHIQPLKTLSKRLVTGYQSWLDCLRRLLNFFRPVALYKIALQQGNSKRTKLVSEISQQLTIDQKVTINGPCKRFCKFFLLVEVHIAQKSRINFYECFKGFHIVPWLSDFIHPFQPQDHKKIMSLLKNDMLSLFISSIKYYYINS